ncbi:MAG TPA: hypothetical protein VH044_02790 [Polyangiaceae bacterium]|jgi:hypothetical protein|nr:hypothetical protein [Polyangiaceae bacterium]
MNLLFKRSLVSLFALTAAVVAVPQSASAYTVTRINAEAGSAFPISYSSCFVNNGQIVNSGCSFTAAWDVDVPTASCTLDQFGCGSTDQAHAWAEEGPNTYSQLFTFTIDGTVYAGSGMGASGATSRHEDRWNATFPDQGTAILEFYIPQNAHATSVGYNL